MQETLKQINANSMQTIESFSSIQNINKVGKASEDLTSLKKVNRNKVLGSDKCQIHPNTNQDILCLTDSTWVCLTCAHSDAHKTHLMISITEMKEQIKQLKSQSQEISKFTRGKINTLIGSALAREHKKVEEKKSEMNRQVKIHYSKLYKQLERQEQYCYDEITRHYQNQFSFIQEQLGKVQNEFIEKSQKYQNKLAHESINLQNKTQCAEIYQTYLKQLKIQSGNQISLKNFEAEWNSKILRVSDIADQNLRVGKIIVQPLYTAIDELKNYVKVSFEGHEKRVVKANSTSSIVKNPMSKSMMNLKEKDHVDDKKPVVVIQTKKQVERSRGGSNLKVTSPVQKFEGKKLLKSSLSSKGLQKVGASKGIQSIMSNFIAEPSKDTLDLSNFPSSSLRENLISIIQKVIEHRTIPKLKLSRVSLIDDQFHNLLPFLNSTESLNISFNNLTETAFVILTDYLKESRKKEIEVNLKSINICRNKFLQNSKSVRDRIAELKIQFGITVVL